MQDIHRVFAVVPAAGRSRRMGRHKLLLPIDGRTVIARLVETLRATEIAAVVVVVRPDDDALQAELARLGVSYVAPAESPETMRHSVQFALEEIRGRFSPVEADGWMLAPGDSPSLKSSVVQALIQRWKRGDCTVLVPTFQQRRGHPPIFRWSLAEAVAAIPADHGLNWLLRCGTYPVTELVVADESVLHDLDTPLAYQRLVPDRPQFETESE
jgi:CTP:molybdopterin cytidylyltransferase MocA